MTKKMDKKKEVTRQIEESIKIKRLLKQDVDVLIEIAGKIINAFRNNNKVLIFGNGGSAADAQHIAAELGGKFYMDRDPLPAIALTTNSSILTAIGNDYGYDDIFARQVRALARKGDIVVGLSTSGDSVNVIKGIEEARRVGAITLAFTGQAGKLRKIADHALAVPSTSTPRIQEAHITAGHIICYLVEETLFGNKKEE